MAVITAFGDDHLNSLSIDQWISNLKKEGRAGHLLHPTHLAALIVFETAKEILKNDDLSIINRLKDIIFVILRYEI